MQPTNIFGGGSGTANGYTAHYVAHDGTDTYANATNSATPCSLATAMGAGGGAAGDVVFIMDSGTYTRTTAVSLTNNGSTAAYIVVAGIDNQNGANSNGGRPIIDLQDTGGVNGISVASNNVSWWENLDVRQAGLAGVSIGDRNIAYNIFSHDNGSDGFDVLGNAVVIFCDSSLNAGNGFFVSSGEIWYCRSFDNSGDGFQTNGEAAHHFWCQAFDNTVDGFDCNHHSSNVSFCTADGNGGDGISYTATIKGGFTFGNILSNNGAYGLNVGTPKLHMTLFNHFHGNTTAAKSGSGYLSADETTGDPDFTNAASDDFSLGAFSNANNLELSTTYAGTNPFTDKGTVGTEDAAGGVKMAGDSGGMVG